MFLISKFAYDAMTKSRHDNISKYIIIHQYAEKNHKQTYYKFRYGAPDDNGEVGKVSPINLSAGAYASVWSLEGFELSERVLAIFGHSSSLFKRGLELIHSPFIDPSFKGQLQLVVRNFSDKEVILNSKDALGKITFFDISDTILSLDDLMQEVQRNVQNVTRQKAIHEISKAMGEIAKDDD